MLNSETIGYTLEDKLDLYLENPKVGLYMRDLKDENNPDEEPYDFFRGLVVNMLHSVSQSNEEVVLKAYCNA